MKIELTAKDVAKLTAKIAKKLVRENLFDTASTSKVSKEDEAALIASIDAALFGMYRMGEFGIDAVDGERWLK